MPLVNFDTFFTRVKELREILPISDIFSINCTLIPFGLFQVLQKEVDSITL